VVLIVLARWPRLFLPLIFALVVCPVRVY
jgi:hypothetical protein